VFEPLDECEDIILDIETALYDINKMRYIKQNKKKQKLHNSSVFIIEYDRNIIGDEFIFRMRIYAPCAVNNKNEEYVGLVNEGNTCYMNTILQSLYHLRRIRRNIFNIYTQEDSPIFAIQTVFYNMLKSEKGAVKSIDLLKSLDLPDWNRQQDVQEIFSKLLDLLRETHHKLYEESDFNYLVEGSLVYTKTCNDIDYQSRRVENFLFLHLDIQNCQSLNQCFEKLLRVEKLEGDNKYRTEDGIYREAITTTNFEKIPQILFLHLKRFSSIGKDIIKDHSAIEYHDEINLSNYLSSNSKNGQDLEYKLYAVIVHQGQMNSGHYYVYIQDMLNKKWNKFNDRNVTFATTDEVFQSNYGGCELNVIISPEGELIVKETLIDRSAYILIYIQKDKINYIFEEVSNEVNFHKNRFQKFYFSNLKVILMEIRKLNRYLIQIENQVCKAIRKLIVDTLLRKKILKEKMRK
jgi:ubiquitin carboxyl-terminal hydrolase 7